VTKLVFENAAFAEMVRRLDRIVPKKGEAFDKAHGVLFEITPGVDWGVLSRATNLDVYYMEWSTPLSSEGEPIAWRVHGPMLSSVIGALPIGSGKSVTLENVGDKLHITSGRVKARIALLDPRNYPRWEPFNPEGIMPVPMLGQRIEQVAWAASKDQEMLMGIHFDGKQLVATDRYRLVRVPVEAPQIFRPVTVPAGILAPVLKQMTDTAIGIVDGQLVFMPNPYTQIRCAIFDGQYPPVERVMARDHGYHLAFDRGPFVDAMNRVMSLNSDRMPSMKVAIGNEEVAFYIKGNDEDILDVLEYPGQAVHEPYVVHLTPRNLLDAIQNSPADRINLHYDPTAPTKVLYLQGGDSYESWIVPRMGGGDA